jgi:hypothetical protein
MLEHCAVRLGFHKLLFDVLECRGRLAPTQYDHLVVLSVRLSIPVLHYRAARNRRDVRARQVDAGRGMDAGNTGQ